MNERKKVLVIDDDADLCLLMKTYFVRKSYEVILSHTIDDGFIQAKACQPNKIFINTQICQNPEEVISKLKALAPDAEISSTCSD